MPLRSTSLTNTRPDCLIFGLFTHQTICRPTEPMKKKELRKKLAKTEKKLAKLETELEYTKDRLNALIADADEPEILEEREPDPTIARRLERFLRP